MDSIAVLLTCHNRMQQTLRCLEALSKATLPEEYNIDIYLVDDGSTDGTGLAVEKKFPEVNVIKGTGNLFWNQGMRLAWKTAAETREFDFYMWLNDDTVLDKAALTEMFKSYEEAKKLKNKEVIITAACRSGIDNDIFSYGGRNENGPVIPNGKLQMCKYINGNAVLVPKSIYEQLGNLSNDYTHGIGDNDYGLRALQKGFLCFTTKVFIATCPPNVGIPGWCDPKLPFKKRWDLFHSVRGLNIKEYIKFRKNFWGIQWVIFAIKAYMKMISPTLYQKTT